MVDYSELKRLAEAALPDDASPYLPCQVAFMNAATPAAVLALIADLKKIEADRRACWAEFKVMGRHVDQLKAENEALRKDAIRLDWLADPDNAVGNVQLPTECVTQNVHSLRAAIDAAMSKGEQANG